MKLKDWSVTSDVDVRFTPPEFMHYHLQGRVYGNPSFEDGASIITSRIVKINDKGTHKEAITRSGSVYELYKEDVDKGAEKKYPNYYERLKMTIID